MNRRAFLRTAAATCLFLSVPQVSKGAEVYFIGKENNGGNKREISSEQLSEERRAFDSMIDTIVLCYGGEAKGLEILTPKGVFHTEEGATPENFDISSKGDKIAKGDQDKLEVTDLESGKKCSVDCMKIYKELTGNETPSRLSVVSPSFSPDGNSLACILSAYDSTYDARQGKLRGFGITLPIEYDLRSGEAFQLTNRLRHEEDGEDSFGIVKWSPTEDLILLTVSEYSKNPRIMMIDKNEKKVKAILGGDRCRLYGWLPDGKRFVIAGDNDTKVVDGKTLNSVLMLKGLRCGLISNPEFCISPDLEQILCGFVYRVKLPRTRGVVEFDEIAERAEQILYRGKEKQMFFRGEEKMLIDDRVVAGSTNFGGIPNVLSWASNGRHFYVHIGFEDQNSAVYVIDSRTKIIRRMGTKAKTNPQIYHSWFKLNTYR